MSIKICEKKILDLKKYIEELKVINKKVLDEKGNFINSRVYDITLNNGRIIRREKLLKGNSDGSAVIIVPITKNGEFLTVIEPRVFTKITVGVSFPAGYIENGEKPLHSALRELEEETGYTSNRIEHVDSFYQDEGVSSAYNHIFIAYDCEKKHSQHLDEDEIIKYMMFSFEELEELEKLGYISGANSKLAIAKIKNIVYKKEV